MNSSLSQPSDAAMLAQALATIADVVSRQGRRLEVLEARNGLNGREDLKSLRARLRPEWGKKGGSRWALEAGITQTTVSMLESGASKGFSRVTIQKLARALGAGENEVAAAAVESRVRREKRDTGTRGRGDAGRGER